ncbi:MAG: hypothetical protein WAX69_06260 [Victivallales bacterium]
MNIGILGQQIGHRAAASKIRIYKFDGKLPVEKAANPSGRIFCHWYEEGDNIKYVVNSNRLYGKMPEIAADFVTLDRWSRLARYSGMNAISGFGVSYQGVFYRTNILEGLFGRNYDACRLAALFCEKFGMKYVPEIFGNNVTLGRTIRSRSQTPDDLYPMSRQGVKVGSSVNSCQFNALHPVVEDFWVDALGELADKLRDSPAFAGVTVRADSWLFDGFFTLPSINWGYSDWMAAQFEKETGVKVPGDVGDTGRFGQRFKFLTSGGMNARWNAWRCSRLLDYHKRIRDRMRGSRDDIFFGVVGDAVCDAVYPPSDDLSARWRGIGVELDKLKEVQGIAIIPGARYGTRNTTEMEQSTYDGFFDPASTSVGFGHMRAFSACMMYHELGGSIPYDKLGVKAKGYYYCSAVDAGGRNSLEKFAVVLADQDSAFLRDGGNTYIEGDPAIWRPWFAEYEALPAKPFTPLESARDPIAVWSASLDDGFYFYAVNRERIPIAITLGVEDYGRILSLTSGKEQELVKGGLRIELAPYELKSFKCRRGARIISAQTDIPNEIVNFVKDRLAFVRDLEGQVMSGSRQDDLTTAEKKALSEGASQAWQAFQRGYYWRARTVLSSAPMMHAYVKLGTMPGGQVVTRFPDKLEEKPGVYYIFGEPLIRADEIQKMLSSDAKTDLVDSRSIHPEWGGDKVLLCKGGQFSFDLDVPADGPYVLSLGHVADTMGVTTVSINGASLPIPLITRSAKTPEQVVFPAVELKVGKAKISLRRDGAFGVYAVKWTPMLRPLPSGCWATVGPFDSFWGNGPGRSGAETEVKKGFATKYPPENNPGLDAVYQNGGRKLGWTFDEDSPASVELSPLDNHQDRVRCRIAVDFTRRVSSPSRDFSFAVTHITSPEERTAQFFLGVDWWANAWLNGELIKSDMEQKAKDSCGCEFTTMRYAMGIIKLKKGVNTLLVKSQGGSMGGSFCAWISDQKNISIRAEPGK